MKTLRLLITKECKRNCKGCCNKQWNLNKLPVITSFKKYDEIILTGGEPLLLDYIVLKTIYWRISRSCKKKCKIYLYTAQTKNITKFINVLIEITDGITLTLHEQKDIPSFIKLNKKLNKISNLFKIKSMRLNIFKGVELENTDISNWKVKKDIEWIENCPLPKNEIFMRL
jgi:hypothetical protein